MINIVGPRTLQLGEIRPFSARFSRPKDWTALSLPLSRVLDKVGSAEIRIIKEVFFFAEKIRRSFLQAYIDLRSVV